MKKQLQRNYGGFTALLSVFVLIFLELGACMNPLQSRPAERSSDGSTGVRISIVAGEERTLLPAATFTKYVLHFSNSDGVTSPGDETLTGVNTGLISLDPANWTITVTAYVVVEGFDVAAAEGSAQVNLSPGELKGVPIRVSSKLGGGNGYFSYDLQYPQDVNSGYLNVYNSEGTPVISKYLPSEPTGNRIVLAAGYYGLRVTLQTNNGIAVRTEIVHIYPGMETRGNYFFDEADFGNPIAISGTVDLSGLGSVDHARIQLYRDSDFIYSEASFDEYGPSGVWSWTVKTLPFNQPADLYVELQLQLSGGVLTKRLPVPISVYDQDDDVLSLGPFTVNQFNLNGVVDFSDLAFRGITNINYASVSVYQDGGAADCLGSAPVMLGINSWSFGILTDEASLPVRIVLQVQPYSGPYIYDEIQTTLTASRSDLNFRPGPISAGTTINGVGAAYEYSYLFVPDTSGAYAFNVSSAGSQFTDLSLYDVSGSPLDSAYGYPDAALSYSLSAGTVYYIRLYLGSSYMAYQFRVDPLSQASLGGTVNFSGLLSPFSGIMVDSAEMAIYADNSTHMLLGAPVGINTGDGSWIATVDLAGSSVPAIFVITANLSNGQTVYHQEHLSISGSNSGLSFSPGAVTGESAITHTTINYDDYFLYVPETTGDYSLTISAGMDRYMQFTLYNAQTGDTLDFVVGHGGLEQVQTLNAGNPYLVRVWGNYSQFEAYQFRAEKLQPATLSGTVHLNGLAPLSNPDINYTEIRIYTGASNPAQLGLPVTVGSDGSWSATIPSSGTQAVQITASTYLNNSRTIITHRQDTISGDTTGLDLAPAAVSPTDGQPVSRASGYYEDSFLLVPSDSGFFNLETTDGMSTPYLYLHDAATGALLANGANLPYASLTAGTPYIVQVVNTGRFTTYQFRMSALTSATIGGTVNYSGLPASISSVISSAVINGYLEPSHVQFISEAPILAAGGAWSAQVPSNIVGQTARLVLTLNLSNGQMINSHILRVLSASESDLNFAPTDIPSDTAVNGKTVGAGAAYDSFLFVPPTSGDFVLQAESDAYNTNIEVYDGLTGNWIGNSWPNTNMIFASLSAENPYIIRIYSSGSSAYQFHAGSPATLGGTVNFSSLASWNSASAKVLVFPGPNSSPSHPSPFDLYNILGAGTVSLPGGAWAISNLPPFGEVFIALTALSTGGEGVLETQTVSVSGDNNAINFFPDDSNKNVATGVWHTRNINAEGTWLLWIPESSGEYVLDAEPIIGLPHTYMYLYDGLTGVQIDYNDLPGTNNRIQRSDFVAGHPYLALVRTDHYYGYGSFRFKAEAVLPVTLGGTVDFSDLSPWTIASAEILVFNDYNVLRTGTINLSEGAWSISDLPLFGEVVIVLSALSTGGEGALKTETISASGDNNNINFSPGDSDKNVATGVWHNRSTNGVVGEWLLWIPDTNGAYVLDAEQTDGNLSLYMYLYDGLTGSQITYSGGSSICRIQHNDFEAGHPYLIRVRDYRDGSGSFRFKAEAVMP
jgi:hypothetical protein